MTSISKTVLVSPLAVDVCRRGKECSNMIKRKKEMWEKRKRSPSCCCCHAVHCMSVWKWKKNHSKWRVEICDITTAGRNFSSDRKYDENTAYKLKRWIYPSNDYSSGGPNTAAKNRCDAQSRFHVQDSCCCQTAACFCLQIIFTRRSCSRSYDRARPRRKCTRPRFNGDSGLSEPPDWP